MSKKVIPAKVKGKPKSKAKEIKNIKVQNIPVGGSTGDILVKVVEVIKDSGPKEIKMGKIKTIKSKKRK